MALFESYDRREPQILAVLKNYGIGSIEECAEICKAKGLDIYKLVEGIQPICFENAKWAYVVGSAIALKKGWITPERLLELAEPMKKNQYGQYLIKLAHEKMK